jgi:16S rRNA (guanine527-N7)-methyltransferase
MKIGSSAWKETIIKGAREFDIRVTPGQADQFAKHARILREWNQKVNLTTIVDPLEMAVKHYLDAIVATAYMQPGGRLLDVGSGAGFPGIVLKVMIPKLQVTLVDATRKKVNFLKHVIRELGLCQIEALETRIENLNEHKKSRYDVIVSRAFSDLPKFIELSLPYLASKGQLIAYKAKGYDTEIPNIYAFLNRQAGLPETSSPGADLQIKTMAYRLPWLNVPRRLVRLQIQSRLLENWPFRQNVR